MPRQPRYFIPGLPQHVIQRGVDRQAVFFEPRDYELYLHCLRDAATQFECNVHAYVLMTNHTHLLITPQSERSIPLLMQAMGRTYVQSLNRLYQRSGPLWQGRYKASLVQDNHYLLSCYRYIELNPVRAGVVRSPGQYPFSSYAHNALDALDGLVTPHSVYLSLGPSTASRLAAYRKLFSNELSPELLTLIRSVTNACQLLGSDGFKDQIEAMLGRSVRPGKSGRPKGS
ncbi:MAG: transposase [Pseudomonadota bacterium]